MAITPPCPARNESHCLFLGTIEPVEQPAEFGGDLFKLFAMHGGKFLQCFFTVTGELNEHLPPVLIGHRARQQFLHDHPVNQPDRAVMTKLQSFGQFTDGDTVAPRKPLDGQQCLMLLWSDAGSLRRRFAEMDESPKRIPKRREGFILPFAKFFKFFHLGKSNICFMPAATIC